MGAMYLLLMRTGSSVDHDVSLTIRHQRPIP